MVRRPRRIEQMALTVFLIAACVTLAFAALAAHAQDRIPARPPVPVSSVQPNSLN